MQTDSHIDKICSEFIQETMYHIVYLYLLFFYSSECQNWALASPVTYQGKVTVRLIFY